MFSPTSLKMHPKHHESFQGVSAAASKKFTSVVVHETRQLSQSTLHTPPPEDVEADDSISQRAEARSRTSSTSSSSSLGERQDRSPSTDSLEYTIDPTRSSAFYAELVGLRLQVAKLQAEKKVYEQKWLSFRTERDDARVKARMLEDELAAKSALQSARPATIPRSPTPLLGDVSASGPAGVAEDDEDDEPDLDDCLVIGREPVPRADPVNWNLTPEQREAEAHAKFKLWDEEDATADVETELPKFKLVDVNSMFYCAGDRYFCKTCLYEIHPLNIALRSHLSRATMSATVAEGSHGEEPQGPEREERKEPTEPSTMLGMLSKYNPFRQAPEQRPAEDSDSDSGSESEERRNSSYEVTPGELPALTLADLLKHCVSLHPAAYTYNAGIKFKETYDIRKRLGVI